VVDQLLTTKSGRVIALGGNSVYVLRRQHHAGGLAWKADTCAPAITTRRNSNPIRTPVGVRGRHRAGRRSYCHPSDLGSRSRRRRRSPISRSLAIPHRASPPLSSVAEARSWRSRGRVSVSPSSPQDAAATRAAGRLRRPASAPPIRPLGSPRSSLRQHPVRRPSTRLALMSALELIRSGPSRREHQRARQRVPRRRCPTPRRRRQRRLRPGPAAFLRPPLRRLLRLLLFRRRLLRRLRRPRPRPLLRPRLLLRPWPLRPLPLLRRLLPRQRRHLRHHPIRAPPNSRRCTVLRC
jgi:hypothetical protein